MTSSYKGYIDWDLKEEDESEEWLPCDGRSLGRGNPKTKRLYIRFWEEAQGLRIEGGKGESALEDFEAGKKIKMFNLKILYGKNPQVRL